MILVGPGASRGRPAKESHDIWKEWWKTQIYFPSTELIRISEIDGAHFHGGGQRIHKSKLGSSDKKDEGYPSDAGVVAKIAKEPEMDEDQITQWLQGECKLASAPAERIRDLLDGFAEGPLFQ